MFVIFGSLGFWMFCFCFYAIIGAIKICFLAIPFIIMLALKLGAIVGAIVIGIGTVAISVIGGLISFIVSLFKK